MSYILEKNISGIATQKIHRKSSQVKISLPTTHKKKKKL
jgi:hypothetical protein